MLGNDDAVEFLERTSEVMEGMTEQFRNETDPPVASMNETFGAAAAGVAALCGEFSDEAISLVHTGMDLEVVLANLTLSVFTLGYKMGRTDA